HGNRFTPSFTVKNKKRYRYYVSHVSVESPRSKSQEPTRWPAQELEAVVLERIRSFLFSEAKVFDEYHDGDCSEDTQQVTAAAKNLASRWAGLSPREITDFVSSCVHCVIVGQNSVEVLLDKTVLLRHLLGGPGKGEKHNCDE